MADLALSQVASRCTENLTQSEYRRLMIGVQLIKDPGKKIPTNQKQLLCLLDLQLFCFWTNQLGI